jgi:dihydrofolate reductase
MTSLEIAHGEEIRIMKLKSTTNVTVDGVMQGLGGAGEDRRGGFDRGGWAIPLVDTEAMKYLDEVYAGATAFLFGRRTYEIFAGSWGAFDDPSTSAIAAALNGRPKYVVSSTVTDPQWAGTTVLTGDIAAAIRDLKSQHHGTLLVPGSGELVRWLLAGGLIDQIDLVTYPVIVGQGTRLFPDTGPDTALELLASRSTPGGITIQSYQPAGQPQYQKATLDTNEMSSVGQTRGKTMTP